jgi:hypothetical protein
VDFDRRGSLVIMVESKCEEYRQIARELLSGKQTGNERALTVCLLWRLGDKDVECVQGWNPSEEDEQIINLVRALEFRDYLHTPIAEEGGDVEDLE